MAKSATKKAAVAVKSVSISQAISTVADFIPVVGNAKAVFETAFGYDPFTKEKLSAVDRGITAAGILGGGYAKATGKGLKTGVNFFSNSKNATNATESAAKSSKNAASAKSDVPKGTEKAGQKVSGSNSKVIEELKGPIIDGKRVGSGEKVDKVKPVWGRDEKGKPIIEKEFPHVPKEHGFSDVVDNYSRFSEKFPLVGGDKIERELYQITGSNNGKKGVFEWIVEPNGDLSHRRFIEDGVITGKPNQVPKK